MIMRVLDGLGYLCLFGRSETDEGSLLEFADISVADGLMFSWLLRDVS